MLAPQCHLGALLYYDCQCPVGKSYLRLRRQCKPDSEREEALWSVLNTTTYRKLGLPRRLPWLSLWRAGCLMARTWKSVIVWMRTIRALCEIDEGSTDNRSTADSVDNASTVYLEYGAGETGAEEKTLNPSVKINAPPPCHHGGKHGN
ncbi:hypothetical protein BC938DRAFT_471453 [Jimgerdemannia flammicorona]|uniref:Uncharacterized protein n=1 Tax=Jimgerdemannia flammicorona TaxID=994334 RepID=A0A433Q850_9FUNG|nr:hypothetical protein BC938DRAFT_471453 [Jimgerdemannia flammicorona]